MSRQHITEKSFLWPRNKKNIWTPCSRASAVWSVVHSLTSSAPSPWFPLSLLFFQYGQHWQKLQNLWNMGGSSRDTSKSARTQCEDRTEQRPRQPPPHLSGWNCRGVFGCQGGISSSYLLCAHQCPRAFLAGVTGLWASQRERQNHRMTEYLELEESY